MNPDLATYLAQCHQWMEDALKECLVRMSSPSPRLQAAMFHSLMAGGKRLRPVLCMAAAETILENRLDAMEMCREVACSLELIHTYSLIHDDLPAMDNDDLRRGIPTCHRAFDEGTAILAGDALLTFAFECMASSKHKHKNPGLLIEIIGEIARSAGPRGMVAGQMLDLASEGRKIEREELETLHKLKTAALIEVSVKSGALLAGASPRQMQSLSLYGSLLGLAFQVTDDLLDVTGDPLEMGKAAGSDAQSQKATYPSLLGLEATQSLASELILGALDSLKDFGTGADSLRLLASYVLERRK
ncbi:polyprenyl synthetase family protein [Desulfobotulus sp. H1]|uniref:Polyprenyl synthetase family protein n=1 Tax=Desulfobotulus pelophilus TaxID=2823377 RepID=A0ABT3ND42_9BACT|nr:farnesyl diphosphate synthase [Desulfobotulus pelophilus]MCW7755116.1 polyprenyl synthetase family protein [Desulfobotulus pelophilus]